MMKNAAIERLENAKQGVTEDLTGLREIIAATEDRLSRLRLDALNSERSIIDLDAALITLKSQAR